MPHGLTLVTKPTVEPVTLESAKAHIGIPASDTNNDGVIRQCLLAARAFVEDYLDRQFVEATWREAFDSFPSEFRPLKSPLQSVTSITYTDPDGDSQTIDSGDYVVDTYAEPGRVTLAYGASWPTAKSEANVILLTYVAGYTTVPEQAKQAILLLCAHWFDNPEPVTKGGAANMVPFAVRDLLRQLDTGTW